MLRPSPSSTRAVATTPGGGGRCSHRSLPDRWQPSPGKRRVGFRITGFGACSAFARATARVVADHPTWPLSSECFGRCRCLLRPLRLLPAGATVAGRDSHPLRNGAFHGAPLTERLPVDTSRPAACAATTRTSPGRRRSTATPCRPAVGRRCRRPAAPEVVLRRLLSLDYVLEHPHAAWLPTEDEKVSALTAAGIHNTTEARTYTRDAAREV